MKARISVQLKASVLDPQGTAIEHALSSLEIKGVRSVRVGKIFDIDLENMPETQAQETLHTLASQLLANPVMENFEILEIK